MYWASAILNSNDICPYQLVSRDTIRCAAGLISKRFRT